MIYNYNIAIDLDGVLAAWDQRCEEILGGPIDYNAKGKVWSSIKHYNDTVQPFFETLDKLPDADTLFNFIKQNFANYYILSASGHTPPDAADQKRRWVANHYGKDVITKIVTKSPDKAQYANEYTILIDDRSKSIDPWVAAGGIGILHIHALDTIKQLKQICGIQ